jgi:hypothetical protein
VTCSRDIGVGLGNPVLQQCSRSINGQVAITRVVAHTVAARNGRTTRNEAAIMPPMHRTARIVRVRSCLVPVTSDSTTSRLGGAICELWNSAGATLLRT